MSSFDLSLYPRLDLLKQEEHIQGMSDLDLKSQLAFFHFEANSFWVKVGAFKIA